MKPLLPYPREAFNTWSHALGVGLALLGGGVLLALAPGKAWPLLVFSLTMALMFGASALYHALRLGPKGLAWLRRLDHAAIYLFIAGSYTPFLWLALAPGGRAWALSLVWGLALLGVAFRLLFLQAPRGLYTLAYLGLGWLALLFLPRLGLPPLSLYALLGAGGSFTLGALVYTLKRPNPWPGRLGFHELWHLFVLLGALGLWLGVWGLVRA